MKHGLQIQIRSIGDQGNGLSSLAKMKWTTALQGRKDFISLFPADCFLGFPFAVGGGCFCLHFQLVGHGLGESHAGLAAPGSQQGVIADNFR